MNKVKNFIVTRQNMAKVYVDFELNGIIGLEDSDNSKKNTFDVICEYSNTMSSDGIIEDECELVFNIKVNNTKYANDVLKEILGIAVQNEIIEEIEDESNWQYDVHSDEDKNAYVGKYFTKKDFSLELDSDSIENAVKIYKKNLIKKHIKKKTTIKNPKR